MLSFRGKDFFLRSSRWISLGVRGKDSFLYHFVPFQHPHSSLLTLLSSLGDQHLQVSVFNKKEKDSAQKRRDHNKAMPQWEPGFPSVSAGMGQTTPSKGKNSQNCSNFPISVGKTLPSCKQVHIPKEQPHLAVGM